MNLKPQDVVVLMKLFGYGESRPPYSVIASELSMSQSEVNAAVKRLQAAKLIHGAIMNERPILAASEEFLLHGVKYAFPAKRGHFVKGIPTAYAAEPLSELIDPGRDPIPVWPYEKGKIRGLSLVPLYKSVPDASMRDKVLYRRLALLDSIRDGGARERKLAERELLKSLRKGNG